MSPPDRRASVAASHAAASSSTGATGKASGPIEIDSMAQARAAARLGTGLHMHKGDWRVMPIARWC
jgi:hypothetical protein